MTKEEVIREVAKEACITQFAAAMAFDHVRNIIVSEVKDTGRFKFDGVGANLCCSRRGIPVITQRKDHRADPGEEGG